MSSASRCWSVGSSRRMVTVRNRSNRLGCSAAKSDALDLARPGSPPGDRREFTLAAPSCSMQLSAKASFADKDGGLLILRPWRVL